MRELSLDVIRLRTGIDNGSLSRIERGLLDPNEGQKLRIARALGVEVEIIFPGRENNAG
jgi:transcriptional regulator with XRE-family HTH domain